MRKGWSRFISAVLTVVMVFGILSPMAIHSYAVETAPSTESESAEIVPLSIRIPVMPGQLMPDTCEIVENEIYGYIVNYELKKGHTLSISDADYVFSVRKYADGNYSTMLKQATTASYTAAEDMTVGMLIRKPDKSALTAEELASITLYDTQYGMKDVSGYAHRFTVEAETIDGGTHTTRAAIFLPVSYTEAGDPTRLIIMTNGHSAYLTDRTWNGNTADNVGVIRNYLNAGYAVLVVDNTAARTSQTPDLGCPQLVDSYFKAYEYVQEHLNVEEKFSLHSRSFGTFAAVRIMLERPELVNCAVMTGPRVSIQAEWPGLDKAFIANRFGFADTTGKTYEADMMVGHDPYTDVDGESYVLPPTFWMLAEGDATAKPLAFIEKLTGHGNDVTAKTYSGISHTGICTLNTDETFADALAFLESHNGVQWEQGTIASATGLNNTATTRLRTVDYLNISDYGAVTINLGYTMTAFAYDANKNYLGTTSWLGNGAALYLSKLQETYPEGIYFRIALRALDSSTITVDSIPNTGVTFYAPGEDVPVQEGELEYEDVGTVGAWQDGAIWDGKLFVLGGAGTGAVYELATLTKQATLTLDQKDVLKPHANSVCFGSTYYAEGDKYPLLYVNVYNNYSSATDRMEGTCCVYRLTEENGTFTTDLVQVIRIGFTEDPTLWKSKENNGDVRPYGNFVVDTDAQKLYAFVMRDADKTTRFFQFAIPALTAGTYSEIYGCNVVTLQSAEIEGQFDTAYFNYHQGCTYTDGKIISAEGFNSGGSAEPALRTVDLTTGTVTKTYYPAISGLTREPEVVAADPTTGTVYYAAADGTLRTLTLPEVHTHTYKSTYTEPTCTEAGYVTHICTTCGDSYVDSYVDPLGHNYVEGVCTHCLKPESLIPAGWSPVPISTTQASNHLAYKIENGVLTFHDFGDPESEDYGVLPDYTNTSVVETKYNITEWYQGRNGIQKVVFDETIRDIGAYTLTNMDRITEIRIENPNAVLATNLCLFSTENRAEPLRIYAASTVKTVESWIRGNNNRKITAAVSDVVLYYTDLEYMAQELQKLETALGTGEDVDPMVPWQALRLLEDIPRPNYTLSDYRCAIVGTEDILERLWELTSGTCGDNLTYQLTAMEQEGKLNLHITGTGAMVQYSDPTQAPWYDVTDCISDITLDDLVTGLDEKVLPVGATYHVHLNSEGYAIAKEMGRKIQVDTLRILLIGNSHTADYSEFRNNILADLKNAGLETEVVLTRAIIGSIGLYSGRNSNVNATYRSHLEAINNQSGAYTYLKNNRYDLIIVQDYMESVVDDPEVFAAGLASFIGTVKTVAAENGQGTPQVAWFADWVDIRTTGGDNALYDGEGNKISLPIRTREEVYANSLANIAHIEAAIAKGTKNVPDFVIHGVTIKQNAMSSYLGQTKIFDKNAYCILERDTTHMTYELGRYLMGAGVFSEILEHYRSVLIMTDPTMTVGNALTLENGPVASGTGSQYDGAINAEILAIIREAISSPAVFRQSVYVTDPVDAFVDSLSQAEWDLSGITDAVSALKAATEQIGTMGEHLENITVTLAQYISPTHFTVTVLVSHGYSIRQATILIHSCQYDSIVTSPTCTEEGYTTHTCSACGDSYVDSYVDPLGHTPGEPVRENEGAHGSDDVVTYCSICGEELSREHEEGYLPGDINGDGLVNNKDVTRLFQYLSDYDVEVVEEALDVNGDGQINNKDLTRLFQYLSDYDVEIH